MAEQETARILRKQLKSKEQDVFLTSRGDLLVKGKGFMKTFWISRFPMKWDFALDPAFLNEKFQRAPSIMSKVTYSPSSLPLPFPPSISLSTFLSPCFPSVSPAPSLSTRPVLVDLNQPLNVHQGKEERKRRTSLFRFNSVIQF